MDFLSTFVHLAFVGFVSLFPPVNPIGTALIVDPMLRGLNRGERKKAAFKIALYGLMICAGTVLIGGGLFKLFGISVPIVQVAGGILICKMGWELLSSDGGKDSQDAATPERHFGDVDKLLFYPLAFPMTTGAGTISVLLTLSAHVQSEDFSQSVLNLSALFAAIFLMCVFIYFSYAFTPALLQRLGPSGGQIVNRLSAFLVFCVGLQIASEGIGHLISLHGVSR